MKKAGAWWILKMQCCRMMPVMTTKINSVAATNPQKVSQTPPLQNMVTALYDVESASYSSSALDLAVEDMLVRRLEIPGPE
jgi:hypothetical protein